MITKDQFEFYLRSEDILEIECYQVIPWDEWLNVLNNGDSIYVSDRNSFMYERHYPQGVSVIKQDTFFEVAVLRSTYDLDVLQLDNPVLIEISGAIIRQSKINNLI